MANLSAWQLFLWIVLLSIAMTPIIVLIANSIIAGYFKAKEQHFGRMAKAFGELFETLGKDLDGKLKTLKDEIAKNKSEEKTDG